MRIALIDEDTNYTSNLLLAIKKISDVKIDKYNSALAKYKEIIKDLKQLN